MTPLPLSDYEAGTATFPLHVLSRVLGQGEVAVRRRPGPRASVGSVDGGELHVTVHENTRDVDQLDLADVIFRNGAPDDPRFGSPSIWTAEVLRRYQGCSLAAYVTGPKVRGRPRRAPDAYPPPLRPARDRPLMRLRYERPCTDARRVRGGPPDDRTDNRGAGSRRQPAERHSLTPIPPKASTSADTVALSASGRHSLSRTKPGSRIRNPSKA